MKVYLIITIKIKIFNIIIIHTQIMYYNNYEIYYSIGDNAHYANYELIQLL